MNLHNLTPAEGSVHRTKRIGRGEGSGHGGTSTRGNKGQQADTGYQRKRGHEGGQMPIQRRMPKRGFKNPFRVEYKVFNLNDVDALIQSYELREFSLEELYINKLINRNDNVKVLGGGTLMSKVHFKVNAVSASAQKAIEANGSTLELIKV
ncbi:MAG: 50S ribosomal protein L15 [Chitinophagia bacterium]|nr:50S ribosomal protein L15 [Chitinophagia bacterium]